MNISAYNQLQVTLSNAFGKAVEDSQNPLETLQMEWREGKLPGHEVCPILHENYPHGEGVKMVWGELEERLQDAIKEFEAAAGFSLPHNLGNLVHGGVTTRYPSKVSPQGAKVADKKVGSFCRFLAEAKNKSGVKRLIERCTSPRGMQSRWTRIDLWELHKSYPSVKDLEQRISLLREEASVLLSPFEKGQKGPFWTAVGRSLMATKDLREQAAYAAAISVRGPQAVGDGKRIYDAHYVRKEIAYLNLLRAVVKPQILAVKNGRKLLLGVTPLILSSPFRGGIPGGCSWKAGECLGIFLQEEGKEPELVGNRRDVLTEEDVSHLIGKYL